MTKAQKRSEWDREHPWMEGETFTINFQPNQGEDMTEETKFVENVTAENLRASSLSVSAMAAKDIECDIKEIGVRRQKLYEELVDLHQKECILVVGLRTIQLEKRLLG